jgi:mersacidin/lichenicidin family type 2 lantibiotic
VKNSQVIRAWRDPEYRQSLSLAERALLPAHPAGAVELTDAQLEGAAGGNRPVTIFCSIWCVPTAFCTPGPYCKQ